MVLYSLATNGDHARINKIIDEAIPANLSQNVAFLKPGAYDSTLVIKMKAAWY